ncbi:hypothetical protein [Tumebacillus lipolyticus]|uniref:Uncharacterized protein n=1 Tax=Tumebacillus lipolyticus TaxID=1280370 RepID=A0ABW4ZUA7_9BACL
MLVVYLIIIGVLVLFLLIDNYLEVLWENFHVYGAYMFVREENKEHVSESIFGEQISSANISHQIKQNILKNK